jgi:hypothetical protein
LFAADDVMICTKQAVLSLFFHKTVVEGSDEIEGLQSPRKRLLANRRHQSLWSLLLLWSHCHG